MLTQEKIPFNLRVWNENLYGGDFMPLFLQGTLCCAFALLSLKDYHSIDEIESFINTIKRDSNSKTFNPNNRNGGEKCLGCVISPGEDNLRRNLKKLNFKKVWEFSRRNGYAKIGQLEFWMLNI